MRLGRNRNSTRGRSDPPRRNRCRTLRWHRRFDYPGGGRSLFVAFSRSEEHTSELQSPVQLPTLSLHDALPIFGSVADYLADKFGTQGSPISLSTACASGATAIQLGVEAIRRGETDAALCVGTDGSITPEAVVRFSLLSADRKSTRLNSSHPSSSPLFPYTTLFRSSAPLPTISPINLARKARQYRFRPHAPRAQPQFNSGSKRSAAAKPMPHSALAPTVRLPRRRSFAFRCFQRYRRAMMSHRRRPNLFQRIATAS